MRKLMLCLALLLLCSVKTDASWLSDVTHINIDLNRQVGTGIEAMSAPTIEAFGQTGQRLIDQMDQKLGARLTSFTQFTDAEVTRVQGIITESIRTIDINIEEDLNRPDEILEKRLGNVDTIMTKSALTFEAVIRRLLLTGCILIFLAFAGWRLYKTGININSTTVKQLGGAFLVLGVLCLVFYLLPHSDVNNLIKQHLASYDNSLHALDFRQARYHAAQLRILDPGNEQFLALDSKATLLQDVLLRPVFYQTTQGLNNLSFRFKQARALLSNDPDIDVIGAFVTWQAGDTKLHEHAAALLCAHALTSKQPQFVLRPMAVDILRNYLLNPLPDEEVSPAIKSVNRDFASVSRTAGVRTAGLVLFLNTKVSDAPVANMSRKDLESVLNQTPSDDSAFDGPLLHILQFDDAVRSLYLVSTPAYVQLESSTAQLAVPGLSASDTAGLKSDQKKYARVISAAWRAFDAKIGAMNEVGGFLTAFRVNDMIFQHIDTMTAFDPNDPHKYSYADHDAFMKNLLEDRFPATAGATPNNVRKMLDFDIQKRRAQNDAGLKDYETNLANFYQYKATPSTDEQKYVAGSAAAIAAVRLGLFNCHGEQCQSPSATHPQSDDIKALMDKWIAPGYLVSSDYKQSLVSASMNRSLVFW